MILGTPIHLEVTLELLIMERHCFEKADAKIRSRFAGEDFRDVPEATFSQPDTTKGTNQS